MAGLVSCFSSSTNIAFLVMAAFSFITVAEGRCFYCNIGQVCCKNKCVDGSSCVGYPCFDDQDCSNDESCCFPFGKYSKQCVSGSSCLGQGCILTSADCSFNQTCCNSKCVQGKSCIGKYCVTKYTDCAPGEWCCNRECRSSCLGQTCAGDYDCSFNQTCCNSKCIQGKSCLGKYCVSKYTDCARGEWCCDRECRSSCLGQSCVGDYDCSFNQTCCESQCVQGKSCLGKHCSSSYKCAHGESCCNSHCKRGFSCIGESCSTNYDCRAIKGERCCKGKCSKRDCVNRVKYIAPAVGLGVFTIFTTICIIYTILRRRRLRKVMETNITTTVNTRVDGTGVLTEQITTNINSAPVTQSNPLNQSEGSPSDQPA